VSEKYIDSIMHGSSINVSGTVHDFRLYGCKTLILTLIKGLGLFEDRIVRELFRREKVIGDWTRLH